MWVSKLKGPSRRGTRFAVFILIVVGLIIYEIYRLEGLSNDYSEESDSVLKAASGKVQQPNEVLMTQVYEESGSGESVDENGNVGPENVEINEAHIPTADHKFSSENDGETNIDETAPAEEVEHVVVFGQNDTPESVVENKQKGRRAALVVTIRTNKEVPLLINTIKSYQDNFNHQFKYDWVVFCYHEITRPHYKAILSLLDKQSSARFVDLRYSSKFLTYRGSTDSTKVRTNKLRLGLPSFLRPKALVQSKHFTRFFSGHFYNMDGLWDDYDYYWKVPLGSSLDCKVEYDVFQHMADNNIKYGWSFMQRDPDAFHPTLMENVKEYINDPKHKYSDQLPVEGNNLQFVLNQEAAAAFEMGGDAEWKYNSCSFSTDLELVDVSIFRSKQYQDFFNYIDSKNGIYYEVWREDAIKTIALSLFLDKVQIKLFDDLIVHSPLQGMNNCPTDFDTYVSHMCTCDPSMHNKTMSFSRSKTYKFQVVAETECFDSWLTSTGQIYTREKNETFVKSFKRPKKQ